ncbi:MAG: hypothetical protein ACK4ND_09785 [Cytophagaceae bacterium]
MKHLVFYILIIFVSACQPSKTAYHSGENKDDKNYHAKTAQGIISKAQKNKKKHNRKAEAKRKEDIKNATKASSDTKKKVVKNPGPFNFY